MLPVLGQSLVLRVSPRPRRVMVLVFLVVVVVVVVVMVVDSHNFWDYVEEGVGAESGDGHGYEELHPSDGFPVEYPGLQEKPLSGCSGDEGDDTGAG